MKILFISLGCDKNLVDSEEMLSLLLADGYTFTDDETEADIIIINTCCFINDAKDESVQTILEMTKYRQSGSCKALLVTGCMAQQYKEEILEELPEVDEVLGTTAYEKIVPAIARALGGERSVQEEALDYLPKPGRHRVVTTGGQYAYLKIAEGCDKHCSYCIIPQLRGSYRSVPMELLLTQAEDLAGQGVKELILVAQETTVYGVDLYGRKCLHQLVEKLCRIDGIVWIRILYCYPEEIYDELIDVMAREPKVCHYLDLPIQHASDEILRRMGRKTTRADLCAIIGKLREKIPDITLRTTLIAGFPGETLKEHEEAMDFIRKIRFDRLGVFTYSQEEGTKAALMPDQHDEATKQKWRDDLMALQQEIAFAAAKEKIGMTVTAMTEGEVIQDTEDESGLFDEQRWEHVYVARTYADAPDVDGLLFIQTDEELMSGDFAEVKITAAAQYDLIGEIADEFTE